MDVSSSVSPAINTLSNEVLSSDIGTPPSRSVPGEEGVWILIFGDMTVFLVLFCAYLYQRGAASALFAESQHLLDQTLGVVNTVVLLTSSLMVATAVRALRCNRNALTARLLLGAVCCAAVFVVDKGVEYSQKVSHGLVPGTNEFFTYFYVITGLHLLHVFFGMLVLGAMLLLVRRPALTARQRDYFVGGACFWHMVDLLWVIIFPTLYLVSS
ncbi:MAG: cytochrome c oxidase subunit 3 family protein [Ilumatobacteraceae bacterium]